MSLRLGTGTGMGMGMACTRIGIGVRRCHQILRTEYNHTDTIIQDTIVDAFPGLPRLTWGTEEPKTKTAHS